MAKCGPEKDVETKAAFVVLKRALELETESRYQQALACYQEGLDMLMKIMKGER
jgi:hypothetical protein